jgi:nucleotide-binding universal stress UspA family protein
VTGEAGIVVAVDGSPSANAAIQWAAHDAQLRDESLTIVHALPPVTATWPTTPVLTEVTEWQQGVGQQILDEAVVVAKGAAHGALHISARLLSTAIVPGLVEISGEALMIAVGNRGRGRIARTLLGSVSTGLVHHSKCPVAIIREENRLVEASGRGPVLLGFDDSPASEAATTLAFDEASRRGVELVALHAWWSSGTFELELEWDDDIRIEVERTFADQMDAWQQRYPDVSVRRIVVRDQPALRLVEYPDSPQLIVVGSRGRGGIASALLGSVSTAVVQAAQIPVIVARS